MIPMLLLWTLTGCGWWEHHQACTAARSTEAAAWGVLTTALATDTASIDATGLLAAATELDGRAKAAGAAAVATPAQTGEAAQDAFTRASRASGTASGQAQATWTDWSLKVQGHGLDADHQAARVPIAIERIEAWGKATAAVRLRLGLARARYEAAVQTGEGRLGVPDAFQGLGALAPLPAEPPKELAELQAAVATADADHRAAQAGLKAALDDADRLAFDVDRAGQIAATDATDYAFLNFPPEAQVAQAAALAAGASGTRATESTVRLRAAVSAHRNDLEAPPAMPPGSATALAAAEAAVKGTVAACE